MKLDSYESSGKVSAEFDDFIEDMQTILNFGKLQYQVVSTPPTWRAENGEAVLFTSANTSRWYFYLAGSWNALEFLTQQIGGYVSFSGSGNVTVNDSVNVTSVTDNGTGDYTINWDTPFSTRTYAVVGSVQQYGTGTAMFVCLANTRGGLVNPGENSITVRTRTLTGQGISPEPLTDASLVHLIAI